MPMAPVNLYCTPKGEVVLRYRRTGGATAERRVPFPARLLAAPPDPLAEVRVRTLSTPREAVFELFRAIPLRPEADWKLAGEGFLPCFRRVFADALALLRRPPAERWCTRAESDSFLQFGFREGKGYRMSALVLPCGKPWVLAFRPEDLLDALPPPAPFPTMDILSEADGLPEQIDPDQAWDTRIRLPIPDNGGATLFLRPDYCR